MPFVFFGAEEDFIELCLVVTVVAIGGIASLIKKAAEKAKGVPQGQRRPGMPRTGDRPELDALRRALGLDKIAGAPRPAEPVREEPRPRRAPEPQPVLSSPPPLPVSAPVEAPVSPRGRDAYSLPGAKQTVDQLISERLSALDLSPMQRMYVMSEIFSRPKCLRPDNQAFPSMIL